MMGYYDAAAGLFAVSAAIAGYYASTKLAVFRDDVRRVVWAFSGLAGASAFAIVFAGLAAVFQLPVFFVILHPIAVMAAYAAALSAIAFACVHFVQNLIACEAKQAVLGGAAQHDAHARDRSLAMSKAQTLVARALLEHRDDPAAFARVVLEIIAKALGVPRASIWLYNEKARGLASLDAFDARTQSHEQGHWLSATHYPRYFKALQTYGVINAPNASVDARTSEFGATYLKLFDVASLLDAPIRTPGRFHGVLCCEATTVPRHWTPADEDFAMGMAQLIAVALASQPGRIDQPFVQVAQAASSSVTSPSQAAAGAVSEPEADQPAAIEAPCPSVEAATGSASNGARNGVASEPPKTSKGKPDVTGLKVLVAEDNEVNRMVLKALIEPLGAQVTYAENGERAVRAFESQRFDVVLMDIQMPVMDGMRALKEIRRHEAQREVSTVAPVYAVTANVMDHQIKEYDACGFTGHMGKPISTSVLYEVLASAHAAAKAPSAHAAAPTADARRTGA